MDMREGAARRGAPTSNSASPRLEEAEEEEGAPALLELPEELLEATSAVRGRPLAGVLREACKKGGAGGG